MPKTKIFSGGSSGGGSSGPTTLTGVVTGTGTGTIATDGPAFVGDSGSGGAKGFVPAPAAGDAAANKYLNADGTWRASSVGDIVQIFLNSSGSTIVAGSAVYFDGTTIRLAKANSLTTLPFVGIVETSILNGNSGIVRSIGVLSYDTTTLATGALLYVSSTTAGSITAVRPTNPNYAQCIGVVTIGSSASLGKIYILPIALDGLSDGTVNDSFTIGQSATGVSRSLIFKTSSGGVGTISMSPSTTRAISIQDASGTIAFTSDVAAKVSSSGSIQDNVMTRWDGNSGTLLQGSALTVDDTGNLTGVSALTMSGRLAATTTVGITDTGGLSSFNINSLTGTVIPAGNTVNVTTVQLNARVSINSAFNFYGLTGINSEISHSGNGSAEKLQALYTSVRLGDSGSGSATLAQNIGFDTSVGASYTVDAMRGLSSFVSISGTVTEYTGIIIAVSGSGNVTDGTGIYVDMGSSTINYASRPKAFQIASGTFNTDITMSTQDSIGIDFGNQLNTNFVINSGSPITGTDFLSNVYFAGINFADNMDATGFVGLGYVCLAAVSEVIATTGKTVAAMNQVVGAYLNEDAGTGTISRVNIFNARGGIDGGGGLQIGDVVGFFGDASMDTFASNAWGVRIETASADNYFDKSITVGGGGTMKATNSSVGFEILGTTKAHRLPVLTTTQRNALTPLKGMQIFNDTSLVAQTYNGTIWI